MATLRERLERKAVLTAKAGLWRMARLLPRPEKPGPGKKVIFVAGVQRSGTNMLMDVLDRSFETTAFHDSDPRAFERMAMRDLATIHRLVRDAPTRIVVVKALIESDMLARLMKEFRPALSLWMFRRFDDKVNSHMRKWPGGRNEIEDLIRSPHGAGWRGRGMTPETYRIIRSLYHPDMNDASALALFWFYRHQLFFDQGFDCGDEVRLMNYETLVLHPKETVRLMSSFVGIQPTALMTRFVFASSVGKEKPPDIEPAVRDLCEDMWRRLTDVFKAQWGLPTKSRVPVESRDWL